MQPNMQPNMKSCLIECTFNGDWVLQESKKNILPVEVLVSGIVKEIGDEQAVTVLKKNYTDCRLMVTLPEGRAAQLEPHIREILRRGWEGDEAGEHCTLSATWLSPEEADKLLDARRQETSRRQERKAARAAASAPEARQETDEGREPGQAEDRAAGRQDVPRKKGALEAIRQLIGAQEFKALAEELCAVAPQIQRANARRVFFSQHYLFAIGDGCGLTTALERLADLVEELGLLRFAGKKRVLEWKLDAPSGDDREPLQKLQDFLKSRNRFKGIFCLDISHWIPKTRDPKFQQLLRAVGDAGEDCLFVFRVPYIQTDVLEGLRQGLSDVLCTRSVTFVPFSREEYRDYARRLLSECGFAMEENAWPAFDARLAEEKSNSRFYGLDSINKMVDEMLYRKLLRNAEAGEDSICLSAQDAAGMSGRPDTGSGLQQLENMVGMEHIRERILEMVAQVQLQKEMAESGRCPEKPCLHMRFVGSPGTGKTTVARIVGKILKEKGILEIGNFYEVSGRSLCGRYVGETAPKTSEICRNAYGSVLFIDESYSLYAGDDNSRDYGKEAIDTLIAEMENNRDKMVVIMSGYPDEMDTLMRANPGLAGRMPYEIRFPNYTKEQLTRIFLGMAEASFELDDSFRQAATEFFGSISDSRYKAKNFSNARLARNLYERVWAKAAMRHQLNKSEPVRLLPEDLNSAAADREFQMLLEDKSVTMGFGAPLRCGQSQ